MGIFRHRYHTANNIAAGFAATIVENFRPPEFPIPFAYRLRSRCSTATEANPNVERSRAIVRRMQS